MNVIKELLKKANYPLIGFSLFALRLVAFGASIGDAIALIAFASLHGYLVFLKNQEIKKYNEQFEADVKVEFVKAAEEINKLKTVMSGAQFGQTFRGKPGQQ